MDDGVSVWSFLCMFFSIQVSAVRFARQSVRSASGRGVFPQRRGGSIR